MKKILFLVLSVVLCVCLLGCERYEMRIEQVVWQNDTPYDLNISVYINGSDTWNFSIERDAESMIYNQTYKQYSFSERIKTDQPTHFLPFEWSNWLCDQGLIDSLVIYDAESGAELMRCKAQSYTYRPFLASNYYLSENITNGTRYTFSINDEMCKLSRGECPCSQNDSVISVENEKGIIYFNSSYVIWYFSGKYSHYMLENLPEKFQRENLSVSVTGTGSSASVPNSWGCNFIFSGGCLSDYSIVEN